MSIDAAPAPAAPAATKRPRTPAAPKPAKLTVPAKPAAVTAGNLTTLAATGAIVGGPIVWATMAGAGAVGATVVGVRAYRRSTTRRLLKASAFTWPSIGRSGASSPLRGLGRSAGAGRPLGGGRSPLLGTSVGRRPGGSAAAGRRTGSAAPRSATSRGGTGGSTSGRSGRSTSPATERAARRALDRIMGRTPTTRAGRIARRVVRRAGRILRPIGRQGWRAAKATARGVRAAAKRTRRSKIWAWARATVRRWLGRDTTPPAAAVTPPAAPTRAPTGSTVVRPVSTATASTTTTGGTVPMATSNAPKAPVAGGPLYQAARQFRAAASAHTVKGTMEHRDEAWDMSFAIAELAAAIRARVAHCGQDGVEPAYQQLLASIAGMIDTGAVGAKRLGPAFDELHAAKIKRILNPMPGEAKWDTTVNRG